MTTALAIREQAPDLRIVRPDEHPAAVYLASLAPSGRRPMKHLLNVVAGLVSGGRHTVESLPWQSLRYAHVQAVRTALAERYSPGTCNLALAAVRGTLKCAWRIGLLSSDDYMRAIDVRRVKGDSDNDDQRRGRHVSNAELERLFETAARDRTNVGRRDAALLAVLFGCGLRRNELSVLTMDDMTLADDRIVLRVHGKGGRTRSAYAVNETMDALKEWLAVRGQDPGALFLAVRQGGLIQDHPMSGSAIFYRVRCLARRAKIKGKVSVHDGRRTFAGNSINAGVDLSIVQKLLGHQSVVTTQKYDHRPASLKVAAMMKMRLPFVAQERG